MNAAPATGNASAATRRCDQVPARDSSASQRSRAALISPSSYMDNPVYAEPDSKLVSRVLLDERQVPFHVSIDPFLHESNLYADLVLPEATYLERWDLLSPPAMERFPFIALRQPIVKPLGRSLSFTDILIELANRIGGGMERYFRFGKTEHYIEAMIRKIPRLVDAGGIDYLMEKGIWVDRDGTLPYGSYKGKRNAEDPLPEG